MWWNFHCTKLEATISWESLICWGVGVDWSVGAFSAERSSQSLRFIVGFTWGSWGRVQTPLGLQWLFDLLWGGELEVAGLLGDDGTFVSRLQSWDKLGLEAAGLLWVQVTDLFRNIKERSDGLVVALFWSLLSHTASSANLNWKLLTLGVSDKLTRLLFNVLGGTAGFVDGSAFLWSLTVAHLFQRLVAFLDSLIDCLLLEGNLTALLKVLLTDLFLSRSELCDVSVVALLDILVGTFQDWIFLQSFDGLFFLHTAKAGFGVINTTTKVNSTRNSGS